MTTHTHTHTQSRSRDTCAWKTDGDKTKYVRDKLSKNSGNIKTEEIFKEDISFEGNAREWEGLWGDRHRDCVHKAGKKSIRAATAAHAAGTDFLLTLHSSREKGQPREAVPSGTDGDVCIHVLGVEF